MERLNFNHLFYFYIVAKEGSIKSASEKLHVSAPTISEQLKQLEDYWDCQLFERKNRAMELTKEGGVALEYCNQIFDLSNELTSKLRNKLEFPKKTLDIGITHFMSQYFVYDSLLPLFHQEELSVNIKESERHIALAELDEGNLDILFTDSNEMIANNMDTYRVGINKTFVVAHRKLAKSKVKYPDCLNELPFFNYTNESSLKYEIQLFFSKYALSPKIIGEADDVDLLQLVTEQGLAFTIVPEAAKNRFCRNSDIVVLGEVEELQTSVWAIIKKNNKGLGYKFLKKAL